MMPVLLTMSLIPLRKMGPKPFDGLSGFAATSATHEQKTADLAAALNKFEPDDAVVALVEMLACQFAFAGILPGSSEFDRALLGCRRSWPLKPSKCTARWSLTDTRGTDGDAP